MTLVACSGPPSRRAATPGPSPSAGPVSATTAPAGDGSAAPLPDARSRPAAAAAAEGAPGASDSKVSAPLLRLADVEQVVKAPVHSLAIDPERGKVAALGQQPWLYEGDNWKAIEPPDELRPAKGERDEARIHFGRDNQPRIMGTRHGAQGPRQLYLRYRFGSWREEPRELAAFAGKPHAAIYGVLGWDDPEVLCKVGEFCLIKQRSGWSQVPLPVDPPRTALRIDLGAGGAYALLDRQLLRLGNKTWAPVGGDGPWKGTPGGAWIRERGGWVSAPEEDALYEHDGTRWQRHASPVREPRGLWAGRAGELWIAGRDGAGYLDGSNPWRVAQIPGPLTEVIGRGDRIWFAGPVGVWQGRRSR